MRSKLQEKPAALQREHPTLQNMTFLDFFLFLWVIFALLDPDPIRIPNPDPESGFADLIESGSNLVPKYWVF
jgi:hypothetical protein